MIILHLYVSSISWFPHDCLNHNPRMMLMVGILVFFVVIWNWGPFHGWFSTEIQNHFVSFPSEFLHTNHSRILPMTIGSAIAICEDLYSDLMGRNGKLQKRINYWIWITSENRWGRRYPCPLRWLHWHGEMTSMSVKHPWGTWEDKTHKITAKHYSYGHTKIQKNTTAYIL